MVKSVVYYYIAPNGKNPVKDFIMSLNNIQIAKIQRIFRLIKIYGLNTAIKHVKKFTGLPLWEIRIVGDDNIRILFAVIEKGCVLTLHGFIKKSQKTPVKEIEIATRRYKNWLERRIIT